MSRRTRFSLLLCGVGVAMTAADSAQAQIATPAQAVTPADAEVLAREASRIDSLYTARERLRQSIDEARAALVAAAREQPQDTAQAGPFLVIGEASAVDAAAPHVADAWAFYEPMAGASADQLRGIEFHTSAWELRRDPRRDGQSRIGITFGPGMRAGTRERVARAAVGRALALHLPAPLKEWLRGGEELGPPVPLADVYRELATSPSQSAQQCYRGDVDACVDALGLSASRDSSAAWYTTEQLRWLIARGNPGRGAAQACVDHGSDAACHDFFREQPRPLPLGKDTRLSLLQHALQRGGTGSYTRLVASGQQDVRGLIAVASGAPLEQTTASWREAVMAAAPPAYAGIGRTLVVTFFWLIVITLIGMRSTRWRIG